MSSKKLFLITVFFVHFLFNIILINYILSNELFFSFGLSLLFAHNAIFFPIYFFIIHKSFNPFAPIFTFVLFFFILYVATSALIYNSKDFYAFGGINYSILERRNTDYLYQLGLSILFFYFGYYISVIVFFKNNFHQVSFSDSKILLKKRHYKIVIILYIFSIFFRALGYYFGFMGSTIKNDDNLPSVPFISLFFFLSNLWYLYIGFIMFYIFQNKIKYKYVFLILLLELVFIVLSGDRRMFLNLLFSTLLPFLFLGFKFPKKYVFVVISFFLLIYLPLTTAYGKVFANNPNLNLDFQTLVTVFQFSFENSDISVSASIKTSYNAILESFNGLYNYHIGYINYLDKDIRLGPIGIQNILVKLVPGLLNLDKNSFGRNIENAFGDHAFLYKVDYSYLNIYFPTEMIISYGFWGLFLGMFFLGFMMFYIFKSLFYSKNLFFLVLYLGLYPYFSFYLNGSFVGGDFIFALRVLIYVFLVNIFLKFLYNGAKKKNINN
jgi:hypothetical protein